MTEQERVQNVIDNWNTRRCHRCGGGFKSLTAFRRHFGWCKRDEEKPS